MYSTCYHCLGPLGRNDALERFPVGRRVAFDAARGRLWAVCAQCARWNLAPLEERGEALDQCERVFRAARLRYGTSNVGLAQLADGTELVRIGAALRPEVAAWRYGGQLLRARARGPHALFRAATAYAAVAAHARRWLTGAGRADTSEERGLRIVLAGPGRHADRVLAVARPEAVPGTRLTPGGSEAGTAGDAWTAAPVIRRRHLAGAVLVRPEPGEPWRLEIPHELGVVRLAGAAGLRTATTLLAAVNAHGVTPDAVAAALRKLDEAANPDGYFNRVLRTAWRWRWGQFSAGGAAAAVVAAGALGAPGAGDDDRAAGGVAERLAVSLTGRAFWANGGVGSAARQPLVRTPLVDRLALEIAAHEDAERAAMADTLAELEAAWREAEELAQVVDAL